MKKSEKISITWDVNLIRSERHKPLRVLLLHGFMQTADRFAKQVEKPLRQAGLGFVALEAPYPVYKQLPDRYQVGYSWYFYDPIQKTHVIPKEVGARFVKQTLQQLNMMEQIDCVCGFSQGAYLAPFVANLLPKVSKVIGIGGRFHADDFRGAPSYDLALIHGEEDQVVEFEPTRAEKERLVEKGINCELVCVPGAGHEVNEPVQKVLLQQFRALTKS